MSASWTRFRGPGVAGAVLGLMLAGCSSSGIPGMSSLSSMFGSSKADTANASAEVAAAPSIECPSVTIRQGAGTFQVGATPADQSTMNMRYQVGIGETARECKVVGTTVTMRVGIQGRVILGPAGGTGQIDVPIRLAVVQEGPEPKTITTKLHRVNVVIPAGDANVAFTLIEEDLSFPLPRGGDIDAYVVYIGFDPNAAREAPRRPERRPPPRRNTTG